MTSFKHLDCSTVSTVALAVALAGSGSLDAGMTGASALISPLWTLI
jgi:hypothetical protein